MTYAHIKINPHVYDNIQKRCPRLQKLSGPVIDGFLNISAFHAKILKAEDYVLYSLCPIKEPDLLFKININDGYLFLMRKVRGAPRRVVEEIVSIIDIKNNPRNAPFKASLKEIISGKC